MNGTEFGERCEFRLRYGIRSTVWNSVNGIRLMVRNSVRNGGGTESIRLMERNLVNGMERLLYGTVAVRNDCGTE